MTEPLTLMTVHAHPDDEASKGAPTCAMYAALGVRTVLVCCTGGEEGDLQNPALREPGLGLQRPLVRNGLRAAPVLGLVTFAVTAAFATWWRYWAEDAGTVGDADRRSRATPE